MAGLDSAPEIQGLLLLLGATLLMSLALALVLQGSGNAALTMPLPVLATSPRTRLGGTLYCPRELVCACGATRAPPLRPPQPLEGSTPAMTPRHRQR
jgi:hypothetical protein